MCRFLCVAYRLSYRTHFSLPVIKLSKNGSVLCLWSSTKHMMDRLVLISAHLFIFSICCKCYWMVDKDWLRAFDSSLIVWYGVLPLMSLTYRNLMQSIEVKEIKIIGFELRKPSLTFTDVVSTSQIIFGRNTTLTKLKMYTISDMFSRYLVSQIPSWPFHLEL